MTGRQQTLWPIEDLSCEFSSIMQLLSQQGYPVDQLCTKCAAFACWFYKQLILDSVAEGRSVAECLAIKRGPICV